MTDLWTNRPVFVTGASGFVGANLTQRLVSSGARVVCLERDAVNPNSLDLLRLRDKVSIIRGSVEDLALMTRVLNEFEIDAVFHLAAQALVGSANRSPVSTFESNIRGTYHLLEACRLSPNVKRVVVASSDKAYGSHTALPYSEDLALDGIFPYDVSKSCTDLISRSFALTFHMPVAITRSANIYGPADVNLSRIIPGTIISVLKGERPIIRSDGTPVRDFIFTDDIVDGYLLLAEHIDEVQGEAFNFGSNAPVNMLDLVNMIIDEMGRTDTLTPQVMLNKKIDREIDAQYLSSQKVNERFGWQPKYILKDGLALTVRWYRENWPLTPINMA